MVEDPFVINFLRSLLERDGYRVVPAAAPYALQLLRRGAVEVDLLITNTPALFAEAGERIPVLYLAAVPDLDQVSAFRISRTLSKPFRPRQLVEAVGELVAEAQALLTTR